MREDRKKILLAAVVILISAILLILAFRDVGRADVITEQVWVLCDPDSYVTLRTGPGKNKPDFGGVLCGAELWTDNKIKNGFLHVVEVPAEFDTGWISSRYIVYDRPEEVNLVMQIRGDGRVAVRKWVKGPVKGWILPGEQVTVWWMSDSWAVTRRGYIRSEFLEVVP